MNRRLTFGTDGWHGEMETEVTDENLDRVAKAFVRYLLRQNQSEVRVAVGFDGRKNSARFAFRLSKILAKSNLRVLLSSGVVPTPVLSFATKQQRCTAGVMVTGGDKPPQYNGLRFKGGYGGPLASGEVKTIEALLDGPLGDLDGLPERPELVSARNFLPSYQSHLKSLIDSSALRSFAEKAHGAASVLIDSMGGAGQYILEDILAGCGWRAQTLFGEPEQTFFDRTPDPVPANLEALTYNVRVTDTRLGIATDGEAARCCVVDENGAALDSQEATLALFWHLAHQKGRRGVIAVSLRKNDKIKFLAGRWKFPFIEKSDDGFQRLLPIMLSEKCLLAATENGGCAFGGHICEPDGILSGLTFAEMLALSDKTLRQIVEDLQGDQT